MKHFTLSKRGAKISVTIISVVAGLFVFEVVLRVFRYPYIGCSAVHSVSEATIGQYDGLLGWKYKPGLDFTHKNVRYRFDERGFRIGDTGAEDTRKKPVILIVGDSTLFGDGLNYEETFGYKLQQKLKNQYYVLNFAVQGYGLDQVLLLLQQVLPKYHPQFVVVDFIEDHDYRNVSRDRRRFFPCSSMLGTKPVFTVSGDLLKLMYTPEPFHSYDSPRIRLVLRRLYDSVREYYAPKRQLSGALYGHIVQEIQKSGAYFLGINYQLEMRDYQRAEEDDILIASYSDAYVFDDGFHLNEQGTTKLVDDFWERFGKKFEYSD